MQLPKRIRESKNLRNILSGTVSSHGSVSRALKLNRQQTGSPSSKLRDSIPDFQALELYNNSGIKRNPNTGLAFNGGERATTTHQ